MFLTCQVLFERFLPLLLFIAEFSDNKINAFSHDTMLSFYCLLEQIKLIHVHFICFTLLSFTAEIKLRLEAPLVLLSDLQEVIKEHKAR